MINDPMGSTPQHADGGYPVGILSTLDIAAAYGRPRAQGSPSR